MAPATVGEENIVENDLKKHSSLEALLFFSSKNIPKNKINTEHNYSTMQLFLAALCLLARWGATDALEKTGYIIDKQCVEICQNVDGDIPCTPDGVNVLYHPDEHTGWCLLLQSCIKSEYFLMSEFPSEESGLHDFALDLAGSQSAVLEYIKAGTRNVFPKVTVDYDEGAAVLVNGVLNVANATIRDPWDDSKYDGADTYQVVCPDGMSADINANNYCFRSDVEVSLIADGTKIVIESNGCPDHENMQNGSGIIPNTQDEAPSAAECDGTGGECGDGICGSCASGKCDGGGCSASCKGTSGAWCRSCCGSGSCSAGECSGSCSGYNISCGTGCGSGIVPSTCSSCGGGGCSSGCVSTGKARFLDSPARMSSDGCSGCGGGICGSCASGKCDSGCCSSSCRGTSGTGSKSCCGSCSSSAGMCSGGCSGCGGAIFESCASEQCDSDGCSDSCKGSCGTGCKSCCGACCGCGEGSAEDCGSNSFTPKFQHYTMIVPAVPGAPGIATELNDEAVGILGNGVLLDSHEQTWSYDSCDGHSNKKGQYHYHIPPSCVLKNMSTEFAGSSGWWKDDDGAMVRAYADMASQFPSSGPPSPIIGRARDGYPIFGLYDEDGKLQRSADFGGSVDECNGKVDSEGNYGYYITVDPPFAPQCLKGNEIGHLTHFTTGKKCPTDGISNKMLMPIDVDACLLSSRSFSNLAECPALSKFRAPSLPESSGNVMSISAWVAMVAGLGVLFL